MRRFVGQDLAHPQPATERPTLCLGALLACLLAVFLGSAAAGQARPQDSIVYRVVSVDANSWVITAEEQQTGSRVRFKLNPQAFVNKRFRADLRGRGQGHQFSVVAPRNEPLPGCCESGAGPGGDSPSRRPTTRRPSAEGRRSAPTGPGAGGGPGGPPGEPSGPGASSGGSDYEIVEVDQRTWTVTATEVGSGQTIRFQVDPTTFVGYEFSANLRDLHQSQGFGLIGINASPLSECCTLVSGAPPGP